VRDGSDEPEPPAAADQSGVLAQTDQSPGQGYEQPAVEQAPNADPSGDDTVGGPRLPDLRSLQPPDWLRDVPE